MQHAMVVRHTVNRAMRDYLNAHDFLEIETPILTRSTPEGARDFLVPSRLSPGAFYALPQSPQLFKQMLMMAGYERYYQIARCFRDEDLRADRQPEFTQLDLEMSFVDEEDVIEVIEAMMARVFEATGFPVGPPPWPRMTYDEAMARYGSDKPDIRFGLEIDDLGEALAGTEFKVFSGALGSGGVVRGLNAGAREVPRKELDALTEHVGATARAGSCGRSCRRTGRGARRSRSSSPRRRSPRSRSASAATPATCCSSSPTPRRSRRPRSASCASSCAALRPRPARDRHEVLWVVDFPAFEYNDGERRWDAVHHPFTTPTGRLRRPGRDARAGLRHDPRRRRDRRRVDPYPSPRGPAGGLPRARDLRGGGRGALRLPARRAALRRARRTAASRWASTASSRSSPAATRSARSSPSRRRPAAPDPLTGAPAPVDPPQLAELGLRLAAPPPAAG